MDSQQPCFSNLVFSIGQVEKRSARKDKRDKFDGKDYGRLLTKVNKRSEMVERIRERNFDKANKIDMNIKWERAMRKAAGGRVKDDPKLLQKGLARKLKRKTRSKVSWESRVQEESAQQEKKQARRRENIEKRRDVKVKKKIERASRRRVSR